MPKGLTGKRDVYLEVAERYETYIRLGVLRDGDKLPSVRTAAGELGVNPNTVQKAYTHLEQQGLICSLPKKGAFVTYSENGTENGSNARRTGVLKALSEFKEQGITFEEITELVREVYKND